MSSSLIILIAFLAMTVLDYFAWKGVVFLISQRLNRMWRQHRHNSPERDILIRVYVSAGVLVTIGLLGGLMHISGLGPNW